MTSKKQAVLRYIPEGNRRAVTLAQLADRTGLEERDIKKQIQELRMDRHPIISMASGGYFLPNPNDPEDVSIAHRCVQMMMAQATVRMGTANILSNWLEKNSSRQTTIPWEL